MRYIHFFGDSGYCGTDYHEFREFKDSATDREIDMESDELAYEYAESYVHLAIDWNDTLEPEDAEREYYENAMSNGDWEELDKETWENLREDYET